MSDNKHPRFPGNDMPFLFGCTPLLLVAPVLVLITWALA